MLYVMDQYYIETVFKLESCTIIEYEHKRLAATVIHFSKSI